MRKHFLKKMLDISPEALTFKTLEYSQRAKSVLILNEYSISYFKCTFSSSIPGNWVNK